MKKFAISSMVAVAVVLCATAEDWFNGGIDTGWPNQATSQKGGTWSNTERSKYADSKVTVSATTDAPLTFTATDKLSPETNTLAIASTISFTPFAKTSLPAVPGGAKAGVIAVADGANTNCYVLAKSGSANAWTATSIAAPTAAEVTVTFLDGSNVVYQIGTAVTTNEIVAISDVSKVCMSGDGTIASLSATFIVKVTPVVPGQEGETEYPTKEAAEKAVVIRPAAISDSIISAEDYNKLFVVKAVETTSGTWVLEAELKTTVAENEQKKADDAQVSIVATAATTPSATVTTQAGLYYGIAGNTDVTEIKATEGTGWVLGDGTSKTITIEKVGTERGFYQMRISPAPKNLD